MGAQFLSFLTRCFRLRNVRCKAHAKGLGLACGQKEYAKKRAFLCVLYVLSGAGGKEKIEPRGIRVASVVRLFLQEVGHAFQFQFIKKVLRGDTSGQRSARVTARVTARVGIWQAPCTALIKDASAIRLVLQEIGHAFQIQFIMKNQKEPAPASGRDQVRHQVGTKQALSRH